MRKFVSLLACFGFSLTLSLSLAGAVWGQANGAPAAGRAPAPGASGQGRAAALPPAKRRPVAPALKFVPADEDPEVMHFWGSCGASAAIRLGESRVVIGSDDDNILRTYDLIEPEALAYRDSDGKIDASRSLLHRPRGVQNLYKFLKVNEFSRRNLSAIEGATMGDGISYWIGSHARRRDGETRPNRRRFFAMTAENKLGQDVLVPFGQPVLDLAHRMESDEQLGRSAIRNSIMAQYRSLEHLAPDKHGIDIEGLAMAPDGKTVWLALRNPVRGLRANLVPIENPKELVSGQAPVFGKPITLDLGGRGISAIEWVPELGEYLIVSARATAHSGFLLHRWSGDAVSPPSKGEPLPEALNVQSFVVSADGKRALLFSDDSELPQAISSPELCKGKPNDDGTCPCARVEGQGPKRFRARWISLEKAAAAEAARDQ